MIDEIKINLKEYKMLLNIVQTVADNCNYYWSSEDDIDQDKKEYDLNYDKLIQDLKHNMVDTKNEDYMKLLYKFK
jgi:hypothetical protein|tara:strand:+ start:728 stop:952 length:225 start_codon:yes stop_codon:yes gene_type:complete